MKSLVCFLIFICIGCAPPIHDTRSKAYDPQKAPTYNKQNSFEDNGYCWENQVVDGMTYRVYYKTYGSSQTGYAVFVVNLTKDKLEVDYLKRQMENKGPG